MRAARRFQPALESMPSRIAPSAIGGLTHLLVPAVAVSPSHPSLPLKATNDSDVPQTGHSSPIILESISTSQPTVITC